jgi:twinkle protein
MAEMTNKGYIIVDPSELESKRHKTDGVMRSLCTECSEGHSYDETVRINMTTGFGHCYRCGAKYVLRSAYNEYTSRKALYYQHKNINYKKPDKAKVSNDEFPQDLQDYFASRCISMSTVKAAGIKWCTRGSDHVMAFVYYEAGEMVNIQYRWMQKRFQSEKECEYIPWNIDACIGEEEIYITEGPVDALSLMECGIRNVISVPNGAQSDLHACFDRFRESHLDGLKTVIIAGDNDKPGLELREKLISYFGAGKCKVVEWE